MTEQPQSPEEQQTPEEQQAPARMSKTELMLRSDDAESRILAYQTAAQLARTKIVQDAAAEVANTQWGKGLSPAAQHHVARWALEAGLDPVRHINVLGGKIYDNAELYIDKLAAMPEFSHLDVTILAPLDTRTVDRDTTGEFGAAVEEYRQRLNAERLRLQMKWAVPPRINDYPDTAAAALVTLFFRDGTSAQGVNWAGSCGRTGRHGNPTDPVGDEEPVKTAITRALRKAAKQRVPVWFQQGAVGALFERAEALTLQSHELAKQAPEGDYYTPPVAHHRGVFPAPPTGHHEWRDLSEVKFRPAQKGHGHAVGQPDDAYADDKEEEVRAPQTPAPTPETPDRARQTLAEESPGAGAAGPGAGERKARDPAPRAPVTKPAGEE